MTEHRYPSQAITSDYIRAGAGAVLTIGPLAAVPVTTIAGSILSILAVLFIIFAGRTWIRSRTIIELSENGLAANSLQHRELPWRDITSLELRYFATKRDRSQGWMQLTLKSASVTLKLESTLEGFEDIARAAARAALQRELPLSDSTQENLRALKLPTDHLREQNTVIKETS